MYHVHLRHQLARGSATLAQTLLAPAAAGTTAAAPAPGAETAAAEPFARRGQEPRWSQRLLIKKVASVTAAASAPSAISVACLLFDALHHREQLDLHCTRYRALRARSVTGPKEPHLGQFGFRLLRISARQQVKVAQLGIARNRVQQIATHRQEHLEMMRFA